MNINMKERRSKAEGEKKVGFEWIRNKVRNRI